MPALTRRFDRVLTTGVMVAAVLFFVFGRGSAAHAAIPNFLMTWDASGDLDAFGNPIPPFTYDPLIYGIVEDNLDGTFTYIGGWDDTIFTGGLDPIYWSLSWIVTVDTDPFVDASLTVFNASGLDQSFSLLMTLAVAPSIPAGAGMSGSVTGNVTDLFGDGATLSAPASGSVYKAFVDGTVTPTDVVASLHDDPFAHTFTGGTTSIPSAAFSDPLSPAVTAEIGVEVAFTLTSLDQADITGVFNIVPGPASLGLMAVYGLVIRKRRRRC